MRLPTFRPPCLFSRVKPPSTAAGERVYAIGDVHGRLDLLRRLMGQLQDDARSGPHHGARIVLLGDLIDRGPHSRGVLDVVRRMQLHNPSRVLALCGNHEDMLLASVGGNSEAQRLWVDNGGDATLHSYGLNPAKFMNLNSRDRATVLQKAVGPEALAWLRSLPALHRSGDYVFCHAGIRPGVPLEKQRREDLLWIRSEFLFGDLSGRSVIVHGHSEIDRVEVCPNRINVDTAAYRSGELTAVGLQGPLKWFISTAREYLHRCHLDHASSKAPAP